MTQRIAYSDNPIMAVSWAACLRWAITNDDTRRAYADDTGRSLEWLTMPRSSIERMIDEATGREREEIDAFVDWFNEAVWGEDPFNAQEQVDAY